MQVPKLSRGECFGEVEIILVGGPTEKIFRRRVVGQFDVRQALACRNAATNFKSIGHTLAGHFELGNEVD